MIKIFIGKRDYRYTLSIVLKFIKHNSSREFTYSVDNDKVDVDVYVNTTELCSSGFVREHSEELPEDILVHIEEGIGIYVDGEAVPIHVLEGYMRRME
ncbi:TreE protein [Staphylococcus phage vB_SsapH-Golestan-105-M]|nr:TreE protein [Staphylococcus phage vB_SsapH-Golestan-105-M]